MICHSARKLGTVFSRSQSYALDLYTITGGMMKQNLKHQAIPIEIMICNSVRKLGTNRSRSTFTLLPAEWWSKIWRLTQNQYIPIEFTLSDFTCELYLGDWPTVPALDLYTITGGMMKQNLKTNPVPIDPHRVYIIRFHLGTVPRVLASRSHSGPLHYYRQNDEAKSEVLLSTKRPRSPFTLLPAEWWSKIWRQTQYQ